MASTMVLDFHAPGVEIGSAGNPDFAVSLTGFSPYARFEGPFFKVGTLAISDNGSIWEFGKATAAVAVNAPADRATPVTPAACAFSATTGDVSAGAGHKAYAPFAIGEFGWVKRDGTGL